MAREIRPGGEVGTTTFNSDLVREVAPHEPACEKDLKKYCRSKNTFFQAIQPKRND
jgi:hypothetical protein